MVKKLIAICLCAMIACTFTLSAASWGDPIVQVDHEVVKGEDFEYIKSIEKYRSVNLIKHDTAHVKGIYKHFYIFKTPFSNRLFLTVNGSGREHISEDLLIDARRIENV